MFLAQGWNAARDRLWQLDLWKRRGEGTLAEALGSEYVAKDRAARLLLYRGDLRDEWISYAGDTKRIVSAFVAGINGYVALTEERPDLLPPEFRVLDYRPARWTPETVVRIRNHGLLRNARAEAARLRFLRRWGAAALALRDHYEPERELVVPEGLELDALPQNALADYELGTGAVSFESLANKEEEDESGAPARPATSASLLGGVETLLASARSAGDAKAHDDPSAHGDARHDERSLQSSAEVAGSNNWAIAPSRTATGRALLANDPHRALELPSLRYLVHLSSPTLALAGAGEPALPGVSLGHNGEVAFGFTIFSMDQEDLYVHRTRPGDPPSYWHDGGWERMTEVRERVAVRGGDAEGEEVVLRFTRYGPVIAEDRERGVAISLRAAWLEPGMAPYLASLELQRSRHWDDFLAALNRWGLPGENLVYADTTGTIGWKPAGRTPRRRGWDGLLPVPGDGRYEWEGYHDGDQLPVERNPDRGWVATANQMNVPAGFPHAFGYEWAPPFRYRRIAEALDANPRFGVDDAVALQTDVVSLPARILVAKLEGLAGADERQRRALALLAGWDHRLDRSSAAAALFEVWKDEHFPAAFWKRAAQARGLSAEVAEALEGSTVNALFDAIESDVLDPEAMREVLLASLGEAAVAVEEKLGADWTAWKWGALHHSRLEHPLSTLLRERFQIEPDVGPLPRGGSGETPNATTYRSSDFRQESGASVRVVLDVGNWDGSRAMNTPGQSGVPGSPHYRDLFPSWAADESFPFLWTRERIEAETVRRIRLEPR